MNRSIEDIFQPLWESISPRQQEVISGRFGLGKFKKPQTLAALGKKYGITRERVRQIEAAALKALRARILGHATLNELFEKSRKELKSKGGIMGSEAMITFERTLIPDITQNHLALVLAASGAFYFHAADEDFNDFYYLDQAHFRSATDFISDWVNVLNAGKDSVLAGKYTETLKKFLKEKGIGSSIASTYLAISKKIYSNPFGDTGLSEWPEIRPMTIRDRIYLVLKKNGKPLHFESIAGAINSAGFDARKALAPTVHNELIKDSRFILVGRGMYGLAEHGFTAGTAKDIISRILKERGPMKPRDVIMAIEKERFLKPNTVLVNLQNKSFFSRMDDGRYTVREA